MPPAADLAAGARLHGLVAAWSASGLVSGVHDCSDGGLAVALAEMAIGGGCGFAVAATGPWTGWSGRRLLLGVRQPGRGRGGQAQVDEILGRAAAGRRAGG